MKPGKLDLPTIWRGCDWGPVYLRWKNANGVKIDIGPWTPKAQSLNVNLNAQKQTPSTEGLTTLSLPKSQTLHLKLGTENWDWIWEGRDVQGNVLTRYPPFLSGKVAIKEPVTGVNGDTPPGIAQAAVSSDFVEESPMIELPS
jgi:hypothetical protein